MGQAFYWFDRDGAMCEIARGKFGRSDATLLLEFDLVITNDFYEIG
jgi:hypothetical protein